jgi:hypothetical protein
MKELEKLDILEQLRNLRISVKNRQNLIAQAGKPESYKQHHRNMIDFEMKKIIELENKLKRG